MVDIGRQSPKGGCRTDGGNLVFGEVRGDLLQLGRRKARGTLLHFFWKSGHLRMFLDALEESHDESQFNLSFNGIKGVLCILIT